MLGNLLDMFIPDLTSGGPLWNPLIIFLVLFSCCGCIAALAFVFGGG
jgi:hypothetical protein